MDLEPLVIPIVEYFNKNSLPTCMSCQGHNKTNMSMFWIQFDSSVTDKSIQVFMQNHLDWRGMFVSCGRFAKRIFGFYGVKDRQWKSEEHWCYFAATPEAASEDLMRWKNESDKWEGFDGERYKQWIAELQFRGKI